MARCSVLVVALLALSAAASGRRARADGMDLVLSRLSSGECGQTLAGASDFSLTRADGSATLAVDRRAYAELAAALAPVTLAPVYAPVSTRGARSFALAIDTQVVGLDAGSAAVARGTEGRAARTCDGRNGGVPRALVGNRILVDKGLPLGLSIGAHAGRVHAPGLYVAGAYGKLGLLEGFSSRWLPDVAARLASSALAGSTPLGLFTWQLDLTASKRLIVGPVALAPYAGVSLVATRATTARVDLTPNIDAFACAHGDDPVCSGQGVSGSRADYAHDATFPKLWLGRARAHFGASLAIGPLMVLVEGGADLVRPELLAPLRSAHAPRQWHVSVAPALVY